MTITDDPTLAIRLAALGPLRARVSELLAHIPPPSDAPIGAWSGAARSAFESTLVELRSDALSAADAIASAQALTGRSLPDD